MVTVDKEVMHGTPCSAHTRVPVQTLIDLLETGETIDEFLAVYPGILRQHVFSFLELSRDIAIDPRLVEAFPDHYVQTLFGPGWQHPKDHVLVKQPECDLLITADRHCPCGAEQNRFLSTTAFEELAQYGHATRGHCGRVSGRLGAASGGLRFA